MSTITADPITSSHTGRKVDEKPITLKEIRRLRPDVPKWEVQSITLHYCTPFETGDEPTCNTRAGRFRNAKYLLSEFDAELRRRATRRPADCFRFTDREGTWVAKEELPGGIHYETADRMYRDGLIRKPRMVLIDGPPFQRKFWHLSDVTEVWKTYDTPKLQRDKARTLAEMEKLHDDEKVNRREAKLLGFKSNWLTAHSDIPHPARKRTPKVVIPLGRVIHGEARDRIVGDRESRRRRFDPWYRIGDLRECLHLRQSPPIPKGAVFIAEAVEKLKQHGIERTFEQLVRLIDRGIIEGDRITIFRHDFAPLKKIWMKWDDWKKIPARPSLFEKLAATPTAASAADSISSDQPKTPGAVAAPPAPPSQKPQDDDAAAQNDRLTLRGDIAFLGGTPYPLSASFARILRLLIDARGATVSSSAMKVHPKSGERPDKIIKAKGNPKEIRGLIKSSPGKTGGFRLLPKAFAPQLRP